MRHKVFSVSIDYEVTMVAEDEDDAVRKVLTYLKGNLEKLTVSAEKEIEFDDLNEEVQKV